MPRSAAMSRCFRPRWSSRMIGRRSRSPRSSAWRNACSSCWASASGEGMRITGVRRRRSWVVRLHLVRTGQHQRARVQGGGFTPVRAPECGGLSWARGSDGAAGGSLLRYEHGAATGAPGRPAVLPRAPLHPGPRCSTRCSGVPAYVVSTYGRMLHRYTISAGLSPPARENVGAVARGSFFPTPRFILPERCSGVAARRNPLSRLAQPLLDRVLHRPPGRSGNARDQSLALSAPARATGVLAWPPDRPAHARGGGRGRLPPERPPARIRPCAREALHRRRHARSTRHRAGPMPLGQQQSGVVVQRFDRSPPAVLAVQSAGVRGADLPAQPPARTAHRGTGGHRRRVPGHRPEVAGHGGPPGGRGGLYVQLPAPDRAAADEFWSNYEAGY
jgi:hypothetical protein